MTAQPYKYHPISTEEDDGRPAKCVIELSDGKPSEDNYRSISDYGSAFSYSRQINLHTLTGKGPSFYTFCLFTVDSTRETPPGWHREIGSLLRHSVLLDVHLSSSTLVTDLRSQSNGSIGTERLFTDVLSSSAFVPTNNWSSIVWVVSNHPLVDQVSPLSFLSSIMSNEYDRTRIVSLFLLLK